MHKSMSLCIVATIVAALFAGCARHDVVKSDTGEMPGSHELTKRPVAPVSPVAPPATQAVQTPAKPVQQQPGQKQSSVADLQSALQKIYFDFDSADLSQSARTALTQNAALLAKEPAVDIRIEGNCDEHGSAEYNLALGERRAQAAKSYLVTLGVNDKRLSTISYGKERPVARGHDEESWRSNRRDEFVVSR